MKMEKKKENPNRHRHNLAGLKQLLELASKVLSFSTGKYEHALYTHQEDNSELIAMHKRRSNGQRQVSQLSYIWGPVINLIYCNNKNPI